MTWKTRNASNTIEAINDAIINGKVFIDNAAGRLSRETSVATLLDIIVSLSSEQSRLAGVMSVGLENAIVVSRGANDLESLKLISQAMTVAITEARRLVPVGDRGFIQEKTLSELNQVREVKLHPEAVATLKNLLEKLSKMID